MKSRSIKILLSVITGILFTAASFFYRDTAEIHTDQALVLRICRSFKKSERMEADYIQKKYLLINTILPQKYQDANNFTHRAQLVTLMRILSKNQHAFKYVVLDVLLDKPVQQKSVDDSLKFYIDHLQENKKILFSGVWNEKDNDFLYQVNEPVPASVGDISFEYVDNKFFQYKLCLNGTQVKSLPFLMYLKNEQATAEYNRFGIVKMVDKTGRESHYFNSFTPEMFFYQEDFDKLFAANNGNEAVNDSTVYCDLESIIANPESEDYTNEQFDSVSHLQELLTNIKQKDKVIFIGDFSAAQNDSHFTTEGILKGPEILINVLYGVERGNNKLTWGHTLFMLISFIVLSLFIYMPIHIHLPKTSGAKSLMIALFDIVFIEHLSYVLLILISMISYIWFNHIVNVLTLTLCIFLISSVIKVLIKLGKYH